MALDADQVMDLHQVDVLGLQAALKTGAAVCQQEEAGSARDDTGSGLSDHFIRFASEIARAELFERLRSTNDRTKRGADQIVSDFVAAGRSRH